MNEDSFNMSLRKFLKTVGVTAQRRIETSVREAIADGRLGGAERLPATARLRVGGLDLEFEIDGELALE